MPRKGRPKNALKHGAFSRELILPGESRKEYELLLTGLEEEYSPSGPSEIYLVNHLASLLWRERRLQVYRRAMLEERVRAINSDSDEIDWRRGLKSLAPQLATATTAKEVEGIFASEHITLREISSLVRRPPPDQEAKWGPAIAELLNRVDIPEPLRGIDAFRHTLDPIEMEHDICQANRLHEEIERTIKRLMQVKAHKQQLAVVAPSDLDTSKLIELSPNKASESARQPNNENGPKLVEEMAKLATKELERKPKKGKNIDRQMAYIAFREAWKNIIPPI